ncbi:hypothetical protein DNL40_05580 [Xylanimonas oleitrophica]|uniref:Secreted protein n=1 Tax=Xylanimonas oleitrophica TaxID=2607479 RepID=A0A2W5X0W4_9MICO|nr:DUF5719 family protein [Xylanimonas oleitrophica]PZR54366.1 hypothetical protein DNL40_05580 [Xylanimonas oleitrophica]
MRRKTRHEDGAADRAGDPAPRQVPEQVPDGAAGQAARPGAAADPSEAGTPAADTASAENPTRAVRGARTRSGRGVARTVAAATTGAVVVAAVAAATVLAQPWASALAGPGRGVDADTVRSVDVDPAPAQLVCPLPARLPEGADVGDAQFSASPVETTSGYVLGLVGAERGEVAAGPLGGETAGLTEGSAAAVVAGDPADLADRGVLLQAQPLREAPFRAAGALASATTAGDLRGLAAAACTAPAISHWIVGGGTEVGANALLLVQNPTTRTATVALDVYGPAGQVALGSRGAFVVGPGEAVQVRLEAVAPDQRRTVTHVRSTGARVTASLQAHAVDGLVPLGTDLLAAGAEPSTSVVVPGILSAGEALEDPQAPALRLLATGDEPGTARVSVYGPEGRVYLRGGETLDLEPGAVTDLPLGGLPAGAYAVAVDADVPVVAGARYARQGSAPAGGVVAGTPYDAAWASGQPAAGPSAGQAAVPAGTHAVLTLAAVPDDRGEDARPSGRTTATVTLYDAAGEQVATTDVPVEAGATARVDLNQLAGERTPVLVTVDGGDGPALAWAVNLGHEDDESLVAVLAPTPAVAAPGSTQVREVQAVD